MSAWFHAPGCCRSIHASASSSVRAFDVSLASSPARTRATTRRTLVSRAGTPAPNNQPLTGLLILTLLVTFGHGSFMVIIALLGQQILNLAPSQIGIMFMECSLVMIVAQVLIFLPLVKRLGHHLLAPAFIAMAVGVGLIPYTVNYSALLVLVGLTAVAMGYPLLDPVMAVVISGFIGHTGFKILMETSRVLSDGFICASVPRWA